MDSEQHEREVRAARNQALFRAVNRQLEAVNEAFAAATERFAISCECADLACIGTVDVAPADYEAVRAEPRHFVVLPGHVYPDVETVVRETGGYVVVEKIAAAGDVAEYLDERSGSI